MKRSGLLSIVAAIFLCAGGAAWAQPVAGTDGGDCYGNATCNAGLACDATTNRCVVAAVGMQGGTCYGNNTCNAGLACDVQFKRCVPSSGNAPTVTPTTAMTSTATTTAKTPTAIARPKERLATTSVNGHKVVRVYLGVGFAQGDIDLGWEENRTSGSAGAQLIYRMSDKFGIGADINYLHAYVATDGQGYGLGIGYLCVHGLAEYRMGNFFVQGSLGLNIGMGWNDESPIGLRFSGGYEFGSGEGTSFALLTRLDFLFEGWGYNSVGDETVTPISMLLALRFRL